MSGLESHSTQDCSYKWNRIESGVLRPVANQMLVLMGPIAALSKLTEHDGRVTHESSWFECWHLQVPIPFGRCHQTVLALVAYDCLDCDMLLNGLDVIGAPAQCTGWVLIQE